MSMLNLRAAARLLLLAMLAAVAAPAAQAQGTGVDPEAERLLRRMTDYMAGLKTFSVDTRDTLEAVLSSGEKIQFVMGASAIVSRPNKLRADRQGGVLSQAFYYDGRTLTLFNPSDNLYATVAVPDNIEGMMNFARNELDIFAPAGDFLYRNAFELFMQVTTGGMVVEKTAIDGVKCDHLAFSGPEVDWQVWIAEGDQPLPRRYVVTTKGLASNPEYAVEMTNWNLSPDISGDRFSFTPPAGAKRIDFLARDSGN